MFENTRTHVLAEFIISPPMRLRLQLPNARRPCCLIRPPEDFELDNTCRTLTTGRTPYHPVTVVVLYNIEIIFDLLKKTKF